jgi:hypothetical protein
MPHAQHLVELVEQAGCYRQFYPTYDDGAQHLVDLVEPAGRPRQGQLAEVEVEDLAVQEVEGVPAGGEGRDRVVLGLGD